MRERPKILFLNPPGKHIYSRDYFCSKVSQADYINQPIDFVFLSGFLKDTYDLHLIDAIVEELDEQECLNRVEDINPLAVIGLIGSASYAEDVPFYEKLSQRLAAKLILIGDILIDRRQERLKSLPFVDAFLHDFSGDNLLRYLDSHWSKLIGVNNMTVRRNGNVVVLPIERPNGESFRLPVPEHRLFLNKGYRYPFVRDGQFATLMTDFGCPYHCSFCVMSTLGWKLRPVENVMEELEFLGSMKIHEVFFLDQTFGIPRERAQRLLDRMSHFHYRFGWTCFSRPDVLGDDLLTGMKSAGCHTIILGLESGNQQILDAVRKDYRKEQIRAGFELCKVHGLRTVATLLLGLPEETEESFEETMAFLREVNPDFASFNVAVPRMGTPFREKALQLGLIDEDFQIMDQSGTEIAMPTLALSREQVASLRKRAIREFYFRFGYLRRRLTEWALSDGLSTSEIRIQIRQGYYLLRNYLYS
ncbi:radical SAM protein [Acidobacteria bacterium AH-259-G07]|nr:radical SAM protein [Acidobacteria bacterium AH-259-G07]